jgi:hypothetical protein
MKIVGNGSKYCRARKANQAFLTAENAKNAEKTVPFSYLLRFLRV